MKLLYLWIQVRITAGYCNSFYLIDLLELITDIILNIIVFSFLVAYKK